MAQNQSQSASKAVLERLKKREDKRKADLEALKKDKSTVPGERLALEDDFLRSFKSNVQEAESSLSGLASDASLAMVRSTLDQVTQRSQQLQKDLADSAHLLSKYNLKSAQQLLQSLCTHLAQCKEERDPPKKFAFSVRQKGAAVHSHADATDGPICPSTTDAPSSVSRASKFSAAPLCGFADQDGQVLRMLASEVNGMDLNFTHLTNCTVYIRGCPSTVHISHLANTRLYCGPVRSSVFIDDCKDCAFSLACQQLRVHRTTRSTVCVHVTSSGIIEDCSDMQFAPYNFTYEGFEEHSKEACLSEVNNWDKIEDFNWLSSSAPSPNWKVLPDDKRTHVTDSTSSL